MDWDIMLRAAGIIATLLGVAMAFSRIRLEWRKIAPTSRFALKRDLEILALLKKSDPEDPKYEVVKKAIDDKIDEIYSPVQQIRLKKLKDYKDYNWGIIIFGFILLIVFSLWTWYLVKDGFTWWALLTGFFAFAGLGNILNGFEEKSGETSDTSKNNTNQGGGV